MIILVGKSEKKSTIWPAYGLILGGAVGTLFFVAEKTSKTSYFSNIYYNYIPH